MGLRPPALLNLLSPSFTAVCLTIPPPCLLTAALAGPAHRHYGPAFAALALADRDALCLALLVERCDGQSSAWAPYVAALPVSYDDPTWWGGEDAALLAGSRAGASLDAAWTHILRLTAAAGRLEEWRKGAGLPPGPLAAPGVVGVDDAGRARLDATAAARGWVASHASTTTPYGLSPAGAAWARSTVWSRAFNLPPPGSGAAALVPVADLLDHDPTVSVAWWLEEEAGGEGGKRDGAAGEEEAGRQVPEASSSFKWAAVSPVAAATPLQMNYSPHKSSEELMCGYGFILPHNEADFFHVALGVGGEGGARAAALLRAARLPRDCYFRAGDPLPAGALAAAAIVLAPPSAAAGLEAVLVWGGGGDARPQPEASSQPPAAPAVATKIAVGPAAPRPPPRPTPPPAKKRAAFDFGLPAAPATQLAAVRSLRAALRARAGALGGCRGGGAEAAPPATPSSLVTSAAADEEVAGLAAAASRPHAAMALTYRAGQRRLAAAALAALEGVAGRVMAAAWEAAVDCGLVAEEALTAEPAAAAAVQAAAGVREVVPTGPAAAGVGWGWGLALPPGAPTEPGAILATIPADAITFLPDREAGVAAVLAAARGESAAKATTPPLLAALLDRTPPPPGGAPPHSWAAAFLDRIAWPAPGGHLALLPLAAAIPPALRGVAVDVEWSPGTPGASSAATLRAACRLPPSALLCRALELPGSPAEEVVGEFGAEVLAAFKKSGAGENADAAPPRLDPTLGGPGHLLFALALDLAPEEPEGGPVGALLHAAGLDAPHWLGTDGAAGRVRRLVAGLAVMGAEEADRSAAGSGALLQARAAAAASWDAAAAAGGAGRDEAAAADALADVAAARFVSSLLASSRRLHRRSAEAARALVEGEGEALADEEEEGGCPAALAAGMRAVVAASLDAVATEMAALKKRDKRGGEEKRAKKKAGGKHV